MPLRILALVGLKLVRIVLLLLAGAVNASCGEIEFTPMLVLASQMEGTLVDKELRPVPNVRVERTWNWVGMARRDPMSPRLTRKVTSSFPGSSASVSSESCPFSLK